MPSKSDGSSRRAGQNATVFGRKGMRLFRSWEILFILAEHGKPLTAREIQADLERRQVFSDQELTLQTTRDHLKLLRQTRFPIVCLDADGDEIRDADSTNPDDCDSDDMRGRFKNVRWALRNPADIVRVHDNLPRPSVADIVVLRLLRALLAEFHRPGHWISTGMKTLLDNLLLTINSRIREGTEASHDLAHRFAHAGVAYAGEGPSSEALRVLLEACSQRRRVTGVYRKPSGETRDVVLAPAGIYHQRGRLVAVCQREGDAGFFVYRVDRFLDLQLDKSRHVEPADERDVRAFVESGFGGFFGEVEDIELTVESEIAYLFDEYRYHPTQQVEPLDDGRIRVTMRCTPSWGLEELLLGFGEFIVVEKPASLRKRLLERHLHAVQRLRERSGGALVPLPEVILPRESILADEGIDDPVR